MTVTTAFHMRENVVEGPLSLKRVQPGEIEVKTKVRSDGASDFERPEQNSLGCGYFRATPKYT